MKIFVILSLLVAVSQAAPAYKHRRGTVEHLTKFKDSTSAKRSINGHAIRDTLANHPMARGLSHLKEKFLAAVHKRQATELHRRGENEADHVKTRRENDEGHVSKRQQMPAHCEEFVGAGLDLMNYMRDTGLLAMALEQGVPGGGGPPRGRPGQGQGQGPSGGRPGHGPGGDRPGHGPGHGPGGDRPGQGPGGPGIPSMAQIEAILDNPAILSQFLCTVASINSLSEVAAMTGIDENIISMYYTMGMMYINMMFGSPEEMLEMWRMYNDMVDFAVKIGYNFWGGPLTVTYDEALDFATYLVEEYGADAPSRLAIAVMTVTGTPSSQNPVPFNLVPEDFARAITDATGLAEFVEMAGFDRIQMSYLLQMIGQGTIPGAVMGLPDLDFLELSEKILALAEAANNAGLFDLQ